MDRHITPFKKGSNPLAGRIKALLLVPLTTALVLLPQAAAFAGPIGCGAGC